MKTPAEIVQKQLDAYNAKDIEALLSTYAHNAQQFELHGGLLATGHDELRTRMTTRFAEPDLHARLLNRAVMGHIVVDHEVVTRNFPEGRGTIEMLCIYEIAGETIHRATFALGAPKVDVDSR